MDGRPRLCCSDIPFVPILLNFLFFLCGQCNFKGLRFRSNGYKHGRVKITPSAISHQPTPRISVASHIETDYGCCSPLIEMHDISATQLK